MNPIGIAAACYDLLRHAISLYSYFVFCVLFQEDETAIDETYMVEFNVDIANSFLAL